jgi:beta-xylosidase
MPRSYSIWDLPTCIGTASVVIGVLTGSVSAASSDLSFSFVGQPMKVIDSAKRNFTYAYAPTIIHADRLWYLYFCSNGTGRGDWDNIRYSTSSDGVHWSRPTKILKASDPVNERAACDPSVVRFNPGDGQYYYLFYSGNQTNVQTVNLIARSTNLSGPFLKLTKRDTWEKNPPDPKIILSPLHAAPDNSNWYGLGEPSVVAKDGKLYQWYADTTSEYPSNQVYRVYLSVSSDPTNWPAGQATNVIADGSPASVDVKYDRSTRRFVMFGLGNQHFRGTYLTMRTSKDGLRWSDPTTVIPAGSMPAFAHNVGVSGTATGDLDRNFVMVAYGAPYDLDPHYDNDCKVSGAPHCWGYWDLYRELLRIIP